VRFPDFRHFVVEAGADYAASGFVILQGCRNPHRSVELKRLVLRHDGQGQGLGRACVRLLKQMAFLDLPPPGEAPPAAHRYEGGGDHEGIRPKLALHGGQGLAHGRLAESLEMHVSR